MKVLFISNLFPNCHEPSRGIFKLHQIRHLARLGEVRVIAPIAWFPVPGRFAPPAPVPKYEELDLNLWRASVPASRSLELDDDASARGDARPPKTQLGTVNRQPSTVPVYHPRQFYLPKIGRRFNARLYALSIRRLVKQLHQEFPFDIFYVNWTFPDACAVARLAREMNLPFVVDISGSDINWYLTMRDRRTQILRMLDQASAITTRSRALKDLAVSHGVLADKIHVLYNGVDLQVFHPRDQRSEVSGQRPEDEEGSGGSRRSDESVSKPQAADRTSNIEHPTSNIERADSEVIRQPSTVNRQPTLLYVGRLSPEKGVHDLFKAVAILRDTHQQTVDLVIIGDGAQREALFELAVELGLEDRSAVRGQPAEHRPMPDSPPTPAPAPGPSSIIWLGSRPQTDLRDFYAAADLLCLPSHMEGVPNVALESFACGRPVVASRVGGIPEIMTDDTGVMTDPKDPRGLAAAITFALQARWDGDKIRRHAEQFDWAENATNLHAILEQAAGRAEGRTTDEHR